MEDERKIQISIEGSISCGKTTLIKRLKEIYSCEVMYEPVDEWINLCDKTGKNILQAFYDGQKSFSSNTKNYAYLFQMNAYITRMKQLNTKQNSSFRFLDRSIMADKIFAEICYENGTIDDFEWQVYNNWYNWLNSEANVESKIDGIIYLKCDPTTSLARISSRGRTEENTISFDYLKQLSEKHDKWINSINTPVLILDANNDFENDSETFNMFINKIDTFLENIRKN